MKSIVICMLLVVLTVSLQDSNEFNVRYLKNSIKKNLAGDNSILTCDLCKTKIRGIQKWDQETLSKYLKGIFAQICPKFEPKTVCQGIEESYVDSFIVHFFTKALDPQDVCANLQACEHTYVKADIKKFIAENLKDALTVQQRAEWTEVSKMATKGNKSFKVLQLADLHIDLEYLEGSNAFCNEPHCCRSESNPTTVESEKALYWGTQSQCDVPVRTIKNMIEYISQNLDIDMIIWTGDNTSHDVWHQSQSNQTVPTRVITEFVRNHFPNVATFPIYGNHEAFPADQYDMWGDKTQWLRDEVAEMWAGILGDDEVAHLRERGFYSSYLPERNLRVIALNTQACDSLNFFLMENITDPANELYWLKTQLKEAEEKHQFAYIFAHIPPGNSFCGSQWTERYSVLIERFEHVVKGQFYGHTHNDHLETVVSRVDGRPIATAFIAPSGTTYTYQNPSFRVFEMNGDDNSVNDYVQYRLNLDKANSEGPSAILDWAAVYRFKELYGLKSASNPVDVLEITGKLKQNKDLLKAYISNFYSGSPYLIQSTLSDLDSRIYGTSLKNYYLCGIETATFDDYYNCVGKLFKFKDHSFVIFKFLEELSGAWREQKTKTESVMN